MSIVDDQANALVRTKLLKELPAKPPKILPSEPSEAMSSLAETINESIMEAKQLGVSPEKLAPLYNSLSKALEICAELKGDLDRSNKTLNIVKIDIKKEVEEYAKAIELSR